MTRLDPPRLSTVVLNYNTRDDLARVLQSLDASAPSAGHEIIVVDNASRDGSAAMVRERFPAVRLIESGGNRWYSGGNNIGLRAARGDLLLILNPDTIVSAEALNTLADYLDARPEVGAVTPRMTFADGVLQRNGSRFGTWWDAVAAYTVVGMLLPRWRERRRRAMWYHDWDRETTRAIEVAPGSCLMARREVLAQIDYFDERLKLFFTDDDLCRRIVATGAEVHYVAEATIIHDEHASVNQVPRTTQQIYWDDLLVYMGKVYGTPAVWLLRLLLIPTRVGMALMRWWRSRRA